MESYNWTYVPGVSFLSALFFSESSITSVDFINRVHDPGWGWHPLTWQEYEPEEDFFDENGRARPVVFIVDDEPPGYYADYLFGLRNDETNYYGYGYDYFSQVPGWKVSDIGKKYTVIIEYLA